ncbi:hypothetical protein [Chromatium okenii]|nr:hypothetical protein [Chromatium okenii]
MIQRRRLGERPPLPLRSAIAIKRCSALTRPALLRLAVNSSACLYN